MKINFNLPIEIGQKLRRMVIDNFVVIKSEFENFVKLFNNHKTTDKNAHDAKQIKYRLTNVDSELQYQR